MFALIIIIIILIGLLSVAWVVPWIGARINSIHEVLKNISHPVAYQRMFINNGVLEI